jgi:predicted nucleotidyltransferase
MQFESRRTAWGGGMAIAVPPRQAGEIRQLASRHGVRSLRVFGSRATGRSGPLSDLDLLVEFEPGRDLLDLIGFKQDVEALLSCSVDVVTEAALSPYLRERVLREAVPL